MNSTETPRSPSWRHRVHASGEEVAWAGQLAATSRLRLDVSLEAGPSYEILLQARTEAGRVLSGLGLRITCGAGAGGDASLHLYRGGREVPAPIADAPLPADVPWGTGKRQLDVDLSPDSLSVAIDGFPLLDVPDLGLACVKALLAASEHPSAEPLPTTGRYGIRATAGGALRMDATVEEA